MKGKDILTLGEKVMKNPNNPDVALVGTSLVIPSFDEKAAGQYSCVISSTPKQTLTHEVRLPGDLYLSFF